MLVCLDHLVKVVPAGSFTHKLSIFPLVISKYLAGSYF